MRATNYFPFQKFSAKPYNQQPSTITQAQWLVNVSKKHHQDANLQIKLTLRKIIDRHRVEKLRRIERVSIRNMIS
jgi:hypothetical protein